MCSTVFTICAVTFGMFIFSTCIFSSCRLHRRICWSGSIRDWRLRRRVCRSWTSHSISAFHRQMDATSLCILAFKSNVKATILAKIILVSTLLCKNAGLHVDGVTCSSWNCSMWRISGAQGSASSIVMRSLWSLWDPCDKHQLQLHPPCGWHLCPEFFFFSSLSTPS